MNPKVSLNASSRLRAPDFALWAEGEADNEPAPNLLIPRGQQPGATGRLPCRGGCLVRGQNTDAVTVIQSTDWRRSYSDLQSSPGPAGSHFDGGDFGAKMACATGLTLTARIATKYAYRSAQDSANPLPRL